MKRVILVIVCAIGMLPTVTSAQTCGDYICCNGTKTLTCTFNPRAGFLADCLMKVKEAGDRAGGRDPLSDCIASMVDAARTQSVSCGGLICGEIGEVAAELDACDAQLAAKNAGFSAGGYVCRISGDFSCTGICGLPLD